MQYEVRIPSKTNHEQVKIVLVSAKDSLEALRIGLEVVNDSIDMSTMECDFSEPQCLRVTDPPTERVIEIRDHDPTKPLEEEEEEDDDLFIEPPSFVDLPSAQEEASEEAAAPEEKEEAAAPEEKEEAAAPEEKEEVVAEAATETPGKVEDDPLAKTELYIPAFNAELGTQGSEAPPAETTGTEDAHQYDGSVFGDAEHPSAATLPEQPGFDADGQPASEREVVSDLAGSTGGYRLGMTAETLALVFMRAMDIYNYADDRNAAMKFILELAFDDVQAIGGAVLLTDPKSNQPVLWFEEVVGPNADFIWNLRIPLGQGMIGYSVQQNISLNLVDVREDPDYQSDIVSSFGVEMGSFLCAPIHFEYRPYGAVVIYRGPGDRPFSQGELSILNYLAHVAGEYLNR